MPPKPTTETPYNPPTPTPATATGPTRERSGGPKRRRRRWWPVALLLVVGVVGSFGLVAVLNDGAAEEEQVPLYEVASGPLTISVIASGTLRSAEAELIRSEVRGRTEILWIVEEGTIVEEGDLLVQLDSSSLEDDRIDQEISVENAHSEYIQAREALEVTEQQAKADITAAEVQLELAKLDLDKYLAEGGEYEQEVQAAENRITIARAELEQAAERLEWSEKLAKEGYIALTELERDRLSHQRAELDLALARGEKALLEQFQQRRRVSELRSDVEQAEFQLFKAEREATSATTEAEADYRSRKLRHEREQERLDRTLAQIEACTIHAPVDGMVIYATSGQHTGNRGPIEQGREVREREEILRLPTAEKMIAEVTIHESMIDRVREGMPVRVTADAAPGQSVRGIVRRISVLPDAQSRWLNPDLKVYTTEIEVPGGNPGLRAGMSCSAEIIIDRYEDTMHVPVQAVMRVGGRPTVYVQNERGMVAREVEVGLDNNRMIRIVDGLEPGEHVVLAPPLPPSTIEEERDEVIAGDEPAPDSQDAEAHQPAEHDPQPAAAAEAAPSGV